MFLTLKLKNYSISLVFIFQILLLIVGIILGKGKRMNKYIVALISVTFLITALYIFLKRKSVYSKFIFSGMPNNYGFIGGSFM